MVVGRETERDHTALQLLTLPHFVRFIPVALAPPHREIWTALVSLMYRFSHFKLVWFINSPARKLVGHTHRHKFIFYLSLL
jgi:hypothetical protein